MKCQRCYYYFWIKTGAYQIHGRDSLVYKRGKQFWSHSIEYCRYSVCRNCLETGHIAFKCHLNGQVMDEQTFQIATLEMEEEANLILEREYAEI